MVHAYIALGDLPTTPSRRRRSWPRTATPRANTRRWRCLAYQAGQTRKGDLAKDKAVELTPKDQRETVKGQLEQAKQQALGATGGTPALAAKVIGRFRPL